MRDAGCGARRRYLRLTPLGSAHFRLRITPLGSATVRLHVERGADSLI